MKPNNYKNLLILITAVMLSSCVSFKSPYERFLNVMDREVSQKNTISQLDYNPMYPLGYYTADSRHLTSKKLNTDGLFVYHYSRGMFKGKHICHYHLIVDPKTEIVIGWGFDTELGDPKKNCGFAG